MTCLLKDIQNICWGFVSCSASSIQRQQHRHAFEIPEHDSTDQHQVKIKSESNQNQDEIKLKINTYSTRDGRDCAAGGHLQRARFTTSTSA